MKLEVAERILLTGAGFTHNFGTPLAKGMWAEIFNHKEVQSHSRLRNLMLNNFDYESVYYSVMEGEFSPQEKDAINRAIIDAYNNIDSIVMYYLQYPLDTHGVCELIDRFAENQKKGFVFTLNQDLFIKRIHNQRAKKKLSLPGVEDKLDMLTIRFQKPVEKKHYSQVPTEAKLDTIKDQILSNEKFFYVKLHGSQDWISSDGSQVMVIGGGKEEQIKKESLLTWYFDLFREVLFQPERCLLVIGYRFGDKHINKIIAEAVEQHGLKIYIVSPQQVDDFHSSLLDKNKGLGKKIWRGLSGYFQCTLVQMFPADSTSGKTQYYKDLLRNFFGLNLRY
ncbi:SIR2 family protein [candidate division WOR-3 bacterium]|nr:SIR2 family protein [candidate division WOR-3 bacterium]